DDVSALRIRVFTLAGMAVQLRRNTQQDVADPSVAKSQLAISFKSLGWRQLGKVRISHQTQKNAYVSD
uniref:hypothetical protein n=1 Tax=Aeromonas media TaxID=651 RepID=UPI003D25C87F